MEMAAGVIAAKARSMLGEQLSAQDYEELLHKRSVAEIAAYLKNGTSYAHALKDVRENNIHRGQLEDLLRRESFRKSMKLYRYSESKQQQYYKLHMQQIEIDLLLSRIRVLISQAYEDAIAEFPLFLKAYTSYDLTKLGNVRSFDELLEVVKKTMYYDALVPYRVKKGQENDIAYTDIETTLHQKYYAHAMDTIHDVLKGKSRKQCHDMFATKAELDNLTKIYRFKKYFQAREDTIRDSLVPLYHRISKERLEELLASPLPLFLKKLKEGPYHLHLEDKEDLYVEYYTQAYLYKMAKRNVYFAQDAPTVYSSYLVVMQRELHNIINIIEGVRYQVNSEDIASMLVY